jgi:hypothetical protein
VVHHGGGGEQRDVGTEVAHVDRAHERDDHVGTGAASGLLGTGRFPLLAATPGEPTADLDGLFEYGLARHLDGFAVLLADPARRDPAHGEPAGP